ncbi:hypothetical protein IWZ01DRAFT_526299 [Phyllosticta capitalensis]
MPRKCGHLLERSMAVLKLRTPARRQGQSRSYPWRVVQRIALRAAQRIVQSLSIYHYQLVASSAASVVCALTEATNPAFARQISHNFFIPPHFPRSVSSDLNPHPGSMHPSTLAASPILPAQSPSGAPPYPPTVVLPSLAQSRPVAKPKGKSNISHCGHGQCQDFRVSTPSALSENVAVYNFPGEPRPNYALMETESEKEAGRVASWVDRERLFGWPISARVVRSVTASNMPIVNISSDSLSQLVSSAA